MKKKEEAFEVVYARLGSVVYAMWYGVALGALLLAFRFGP